MNRIKYLSVPNLKKNTIDLLSEVIVTDKGVAAFYSNGGYYAKAHPGVSEAEDFLAWVEEYSCE